MSLKNSKTDTKNNTTFSLNTDQLSWAGGFKPAGAPIKGNGNSLVINTKKKKNKHISFEQEVENPDFKILVGSHSGNSKRVSRVISELASTNNITPAVINMANYTPSDITKETKLLIIVSTHGEGQPPLAAEELHTYLGSGDPGNLSGLEFQVLALGDSVYANFCQTGIDFHNMLTKLGAKPLGEAVLMDFDFEDYLDSIALKSVSLFSGDKKITLNNQQTTNTDSKPGIFNAVVLDKKLLNGKGSSKETYNIVLSIEGSDFKYTPGDALDVYAVNEEDLVNKILNKLSFSGHENIKLSGEETTLREALIHHREITVITIQVLKKLSGYMNEPGINLLLDNQEKLNKFLEGSDLLDIINTFNLTVSPQQLIDALRALPPRAYSIASSQSKVGNKVHLTVASVRYNKNYRMHNGVASTYFADRLNVNDTVAVRINTNESFRLPKEDTPIIMIGPGTGIAPFRAFIQEREAKKHSGKSWLVFGDRNIKTDFLYQYEWIDYKQRGFLTRIDAAFSRDQEEKVYVQHLLRDKAKKLFQWIKDGAYIYVCGDRKNMANDVKNAVIEIIMYEGEMTLTDAENFFNDLRKNNRYQEDVY